jgi:UDP-N-acetylmuramyl pentapeptide synthase
MNTYIEQQLCAEPGLVQTLLVKGSNGAQMSNVAAALKEKHQ